MADVRRAFDDQEVTLTAIIDPSGTRKDILAVLGSADSDQLVVTVLMTEQQGSSYFRATTGHEPMSEIAVEDDVVLLERNVVVVYDTSLKDYTIESVREALRQIP